MKINLFKLCITAIVAMTASTASAAGNEIWKPALASSWWWHIEDADTIDTSMDVDMFDIDLFDGAESEKISELRNLDKRVVCYFSAGTYESWRPDASAFTAESLILDSNLPQFPDEVWLNIGNTTALESVIKPIMEARLDFAQAQGCDGVEPDNVDGYANDETRGLISAQDQLAYSRWLAQAAHSRGMSVGLKNDVDHLTQLVSYFDFAVNEQCFAYANECTAYEDTFLAAGKPVFVQEYGASGDGQTTQADFFNVACPYFQSQNIQALWKQTYNLDGQAVEICPLDTSNLIPELILNYEQWEQVTLPADPAGNNRVQDIFDELPVNRYGSDWVVFGIDRSNTSETGYTTLMPTTTLNLGEAYWVIQAIAPTVTISMPVNSQAAPLQSASACASDDGCFNVPLLANASGILWNMLGAPFNRPTTLSRTRVLTNTGVCGDGCTPDQASAATVMLDTFFQFDSDSDTYRELTGTDSLQPWEGAWVPTLELASGQSPTWLVGP